MIQRPARPAATVSATCQPADAPPAPAANAMAAAASPGGSDVATAANEAIVSGFTEVIARKRR